MFIYDREPPLAVEQVHFDIDTEWDLINLSGSGKVGHTLLGGLGGAACEHLCSALNPSDITEVVMWSEELISRLELPLDAQKAFLVGVMKRADHIERHKEDSV